MSLYHEAAEILTASSSNAEGGSLKSIVFRRKNLKSSPNQLYALVFETYKWSPVLKEVIDKAELLKHERKVRMHPAARMLWPPMRLQAESLYIAYAGAVFATCA